MGIFGWDLPPGCSMRDIERQCEEGPCAVCGYFSEKCVCPECPVCHQQGDPACYADLKQRGRRKKTHGLKRNHPQLIGETRRKIEELKEQIQDHEQYIAYLEGKIEEEA